MKEYKDVQTSKADEDFRYSINQRIQNLRFAIDKVNKLLEESIANQGSVKLDCQTEINEVMNATMSSLKEFRQEVGDIHTEINSYEKLVIKLKSSVDECVKLSDFKEKISRLESELECSSREKDKLRKEFKDSLERLKSEFDAKLKAQKEEILSMPSEIPNLKKVMDQKIELVELNGQNAVLRSANNENKITLVERKIENIYQLIKKFEISIQGG